MRQWLYSWNRLAALLIELLKFNTPKLLPKTKYWLEDTMSVSHQIHFYFAFTFTLNWQLCNEVKGVSSVVTSQKQSVRNYLSFNVLKTLLKMRQFSYFILVFQCCSSLTVDLICSILSIQMLMWSLAMQK